jgi:hypothetical protein
MTWWALCFLEKLGLAKNIKVAQLIPNPSHEKENVSTEPAFIGKMVIQAA